MADRLNIITTRTGDQGTTGLGDGTRVSKTNPRVCAMGDVDELNSQLGVVVAYASEHVALNDLIPVLSGIQNDLFDLGSELAIPGYTQLRDEHVATLDAHIQTFNAYLTPLKEFILPGGSQIAAHMHVARSVCRKAERSVLTVTELSALPQQYLNRLSDLLFILARYVNKQLGVRDVMWQR